MRLSKFKASFIKQKALTQAEFKDYNKFERILIFIEILRKRLDIEKDKFNILDWGCGRGENVMWLRDLGYNAFGVEINSNFIENGHYLIKKKGYDKNILVLIEKNGKTKFSDNFFHFIFSKQVFEHIKNLQPIVEEIRRITKKGCFNYHSFPPKRRIIEGHLKMPLVNQFRNHQLIKFFIHFFINIGIYPQWKGLEGKNKREKIQSFFDYIHNYIFYRSYYEIYDLFYSVNFKVFFDITYLRRFRKVFKAFNSLVNLLILKFIHINILSIKE